MFVDVIKSAVAAVIKDGGFQLASVPVSTTTAFNTMDEQDQESRGTGCVCSEGVDTLEKLLASKNCCLQKGSEGSYVEELLPIAYLSIFSGPMEGVCHQGSGSESTSHFVSVRDKPGI